MKILDFLRSDIRDVFRSRSNGKALTEMRHGGASSSLFPLRNFLPNTEFDYAHKVGDGTGSSVLAAPFNWIARNFPQAQPIVQAMPDEQWVEVPGHDMTKLLQTPNPFYSGRTLLMALIVDLEWGNAYALKIRNAVGKVVQLWWAPRHMIRPVWPTGSTDKFISHYEYRPGGRLQDPIEPNDVIHIRFGLDPRQPRLGYSPLAAVMRDVYTDDEAANFSASVLRNMGIIGVVISPKEGTASPEETKALKDYIAGHFTGDKRAEALAIGSPTDVKLLQYQMQGFDVSPIRDISEERVCAAMGIPAAVIGFGTGLQQTKVGATMREMRRMAWTDGVIPMQEIMADEFERSLLPEFQSGAVNERVVFDLRRVPALWEEANEKHDRVRRDTLAGIVKVSKAQEILGYPVDSDRDVYLQPSTLRQLEDGQSISNGGNNE